MNDVRLSFPPPALPILLQKRANLNPGRTFACDIDGGQMTYGSAYDIARTWTSLFRDIGVEPGERIATMMPNSTSALGLWIGIASYRAWEVPIPEAFYGDSLSHALTVSTPSLVIVTPEHLETVSSVATAIPSVKAIGVLGRVTEPPTLSTPILDLNELLASTRPSVFENVSPWDIAAVLYTSGTTGPSKGVIVPWASVGASALRMFVHEELTEDEIFYVHGPRSHIGARMWPYLAGILGAAVVIAPKFGVQSFMSDVKNYGCTATALVGSVGGYLVDQMMASEPQPDDSEFPLRHMSIMPLEENIVEFEKRFSVRAYAGYGMTELCVCLKNSWGPDRRWGSVGRKASGWPQIDMRLVDDWDQEVTAGQTGELIVRSDTPWTISPGYINMPDATAMAWRNGWFHTGDLFRQDEDGYFYLVDRKKDSIRRRGENISSYEVEGFVCGHPDVIECAAVAVPAAHGDDEVKVVVVRRIGSNLGTEELHSWLKSLMPGFMVPRYIEWCDSLPRTDGTRRVQKATLRSRGVTAETWDALQLADSPSASN